MQFRLNRLFKNTALSHLSRLWLFSLNKPPLVGRTLKFSFQFIKAVFAMCLHQLSTPTSAKIPLLSGSLDSETPGLGHHPTLSKHLLC